MSFDHGLFSRKIEVSFSNSFIAAYNTGRICDISLQLSTSALCSDKMDPLPTSFMDYLFKVIRLSADNNQLCKGFDEVYLACNGKGGAGLEFILFDNNDDDSTALQNRIDGMITTLGTWVSTVLCTALCTILYRVGQKKRYGFSSLNFSASAAAISTKFGDNVG